MNNAIKVKVGQGKAIVVIVPDDVTIGELTDALEEVPELLIGYRETKGVPVKEGHRTKKYVPNYDFAKKAGVPFAKTQLLGVRTTQSAVHDAPTVVIRKNQRTSG